MNVDVHRKCAVDLTVKYFRMLGNSVTSSEDVGERNKRTKASRYTELAGYRQDPRRKPKNSCNSGARMDQHSGDVPTINTTIEIARS